MIYARGSDSEEMKRIAIMKREEDDKKNATLLETTIDVHCRSWRLLILQSILFLALCEPLLFLEQYLPGTIEKRFLVEMWRNDVEKTSKRCKSVSIALSCWWCTLRMPTPLGHDKLLTAP